MRFLLFALFLSFFPFWSVAKIVRLEPNQNVSAGNTYLWRGGRYRGLVTIYSEDPVTLILPCAEEIVPNYVFTCDARNWIKTASTENTLEDPFVIDEENVFGKDNKIIDSALLACFKKMRTFSCANKTLTLILNKRDVFGIIVKEQQFSLIDLTLRFPYVSQLFRAWDSQYTFGYFLLVATVLYMFSVYRFQIRKFNLPQFLLSYAALTLMAWIIDSSIQIMNLSKYREGRAISGFILNVVVNVVLLFVALFTPRKHIVIGLLIIATISSVVGGGGGYICPIVTFLAAFFSSTVCPRTTFTCRN